jgi:uncharacterized protein YciI
MAPILAPKGRNMKLSLLVSTLGAVLLSGCAHVPEAQVPKADAFDPELAKAVGADERGMRPYVLVILKTGPTRVPAGAERDEMFKGHFANINRLAEAGKLAVAGPFMEKGGWRGLYIFAVKDVEEAKALVATDPVIAKGEMVAEFHKWYGTAALMKATEIHRRIEPPKQ